MKLIRSLPRCCRSWLGQIRGARAGTQNLGLTTFSNARPERVAWIEETELNIQGKTVGPAWSIVVGVRAPDGNVTVVDRESLMIDDSKPDLPERVVWVELIEHPQSNGPVCTLFVGKSKPDGALIVRHRFPWYELMSN